MEEGPLKKRKIYRRDKESSQDYINLENSDSETDTEIYADIIDVDGNKTEIYGKIFDLFFSRLFTSNIVLKNLYYAKESGKTIKLKFADCEVMFHSSILCNSSEEFKKKIEVSNEIEIGDFEEKKIRPIFKWIYFKRFEDQITVESVIEILRFSKKYQITGLDKQNKLFYLCYLMETILMKSFVAYDIYYFMNLPNIDIYQRIKNYYFEKFIENMRKYSRLNCTNNVYCNCCGKNKNLCCVHSTKLGCDKDPHRAFFCCKHIRNVLLKIFSKLSINDKNEIFKRFMNVKALDTK